MKIYLAHPISGLSYDEVISYYSKTAEYLKQKGYYVLMPMTGKGQLRNETKFRAESYYNPVSNNHAIIERDNWMVHLADVVLVDLTNNGNVSIGCMMELAWAYELRKHSIVVMPKEDVHRHAFVLEAADIVFETMDEALSYLAKLSFGIP